MMQAADQWGWLHRSRLDRNLPFLTWDPGHSFLGHANLMLLNRIGYLLSHSIQNEPDMEIFQALITSLHMGRRKQEKKLQVSQRLGINVIQESPAELVISLFVTVNYQRAGLYCVHFLSSILMQVSSMPFSLPQNEKFYKLPTKN